MSPFREEPPLPRHVPGKRAPAYRNPPSVPGVPPSIDFHPGRSSGGRLLDLEPARCVPLPTRGLQAISPAGRFSRRAVPAVFGRSLPRAPVRESRNSLTAARQSAATPSQMPVALPSAMNDAAPAASAGGAKTSKGATARSRRPASLRPGVEAVIQAGRRSGREASCEEGSASWASVIKLAAFEALRTAETASAKRRVCDARIMALTGW